MSLVRTLEPQFPSPGALTAQQEADLYREMNHQPINEQFVDDLVASGSVGPRIVDLGCGPADIPILLAKRLADIELMAIDLQTEMLEIANMEIEIEGMNDRIILQHADASDLEGFDDGMADTVISNSLLHHLTDPVRGLAEAKRLMRNGGRLFIRDLFRPGSAADIESLVQMHASDEPDAAKQLLRQSLHAALSLDEITAMVHDLDIPVQCVQMTSDRHWTIDWTCPSAVESSA